jgi:hypothetical protein
VHKKRVRVHSLGGSLMRAAISTGAAPGLNQEKRKIKKRDALVCSILFIFLISLCFHKYRVLGLLSDCP